MRNMPVTTTLGNQGLYQDAQVLQTLMHRFIPLKAALTSAAFDGDAFSTTAKTLIDLSASFGAPDGIQAVYMKIVVNDGGSAGTDTTLILSPINTAGVGLAFSPMPVDDRAGRYAAIIPCDSNGDIYYQVTASGAGEFDIVLQIWGYFI